MTETPFAKLPDDVVLNIFSKLEHHPKSWASLACVCAKFSSLIRNTCFKQKCSKTIPAVCSDLLSSSSSPPGGWASLHKLSVCCPGLLHAGVILENSCFGLEHQLVPDDNYHKPANSQDSTPSTKPCSSRTVATSNPDPEVDVPGCDCSWSLFEDLYYDTVYNASDSTEGYPEETTDNAPTKIWREFSVCKRRKIYRSLRSHLATGAWNLSREQGNKLLASRFRGDCLYISDWPGCVHTEEKRNYMLFRGIFKNFKKSRVWKTLNDGNRSKIDLNCSFCSCKDTWDLHSAFCLRRVFGYHDDGEPVVRAYVCENGHVSGAWTDLPLYT
ncbi:phytochrome A-associated F-box protein-like [Durio zibethinus]|uniref:Phytochrome A-associated F-box protein-like n=1 Tax=Durio zibethinus TaxID=66656 RepID=A0A6P5XIB9_DURZI|nr:phytochrome A-associated F-box protein-like [Durio zibethinus]XP_022727523.1 phytochrome A-associated F-box protein-like [Durio zibethinus]